ncbi:hypothetical protein KFE25_010024 [Diacronema lutheri]|uniref:Uncharacterized protein n=2 Tax=Diacronema lutheri TaxID=2081491 RepID=A0A8J5XGD2_DIALT|nr:hypothetical protein KFE25_010024 [Diacronema lutheri]
MPLYRDQPSCARCLTGTLCSLGFFTFVLSLGFSAHCVARATPEACSLRASLVAVNAAVWGLILIIVGGMCLAFYDCFRIEPADIELAVSTRRWEAGFGKLGGEHTNESRGDDGMLGRTSGREASARTPE